MNTEVEKMPRTQDNLFLTVLFASILILVGALIYGDSCYRSGVKDAIVGKTELYLNDSGKITLKYNSEPIISDKELIKFLLSEKNSK